MLEDVVTFCPRIRYRKATRRGAIWFTEAMFPGYLFARFSYTSQHRTVRYANGVATIVQFGTAVPSLPDDLVTNLRAACAPGEDLLVVDQTPKAGDNVTITEGAFQGFEAVVHQVLPARDRLKVLLEMLGRTVEAEVTLQQVVPAKLTH